MTIVKLFKVGDNEQSAVAVFDDGDHVIGRGTYLLDKKISRKHALLKVERNNVTFTAIHQNPCYYKSKTGDIIMLSMGQSITLQNKDEFSCIKEHSWLKVEIYQESNSLEDNTTFSSTNTCNKRKNTSDTSEISSKCVRTDSSSSVVNSDLIKSLSCHTTIDDNISSSTDVPVNAIKEEPNLNEIKNVANINVTSMPIKIEAIKQEPELTGINFDIGLADANQEIKKEINSGQNSAADLLVKETVSGVKNTEKPKRKWRDRCWYGKSCYRKNNEHKLNFSHPGDSDYDTDPDDNRPSCSYGSACYRRNSIHRRDFKHPSNGGNTLKLKQTRVKAKPKKQTVVKPDECDDAEDDYDLEDPFINDDSEDDFQPENDDDTDSEWNDSQEIDEDEDTRQLLKEARRITRTQSKK